MTQPGYKFWRVGNVGIMITLAAPKTVWFTNVNKKNKDIRQRVDHFFSIVRTYHRRDRRYTYSLTLGRLKILGGKIEQQQPLRR